MTFRFYEKDNNTEYLDDARELCERLHISHITYDARNEFRERIISYFINEYMTGRTPVPCTLCNNYLKWPLLKKLADEKASIILLLDIMYKNGILTDIGISQPEQM